MNYLPPVTPPVRKSLKMSPNEEIIKIIMDSMSYPGFWEDLNHYPLPLRDALSMTSRNCPLDDIHWYTSQQPLLKEPNSGVWRTTQ